MPIWSEILKELEQDRRAPDDLAHYDRVRRKYLQQLNKHTGRDIILYASGWLQNSQVPSREVLISDEDIHALMEVSQGLRGPDLDVILHSPGGGVP